MPVSASKGCLWAYSCITSLSASIVTLPSSYYSDLSSSYKDPCGLHRALPENPWQSPHLPILNLIGKSLFAMEGDICRFQSLGCGYLSHHPTHLAFLEPICANCHCLESHTVSHGGC